MNHGVSHIPCSTDNLLSQAPGSPCIYGLLAFSNPYVTFIIFFPLPESKHKTFKFCVLFSIFEGLKTILSIPCILFVTGSLPSIFMSFYQSIYLSIYLCSNSNLSVCAALSVNILYHVSQGHKQQALYTNKLIDGEYR